MQRALRILSVALITAGLVVLTDVGVTLAWKEPLSTLYGWLKQDQAEDELNALSDDFLEEHPYMEIDVSQVPERARELAKAYKKKVRDGRGIGRIRIDEIDLNMVVVEGTDTAALQKGPGHYTRAPDPDFRRQGDGSAFPGEGRTVGIAGHRTTYLAPFRKLDELERGDEIVLEMPYATFRYEAIETDIVSPTDIEVVRNTGSERVVLTACHPLYSAAQRIVVTGRLASISLYGLDELTWYAPGQGARRGAGARRARLGLRLDGRRLGDRLGDGGRLRLGDRRRLGRRGLRLGLSLGLRDGPRALRAVVARVTLVAARHDRERDAQADDERAQDDQRRLDAAAHALAVRRLPVGRPAAAVALLLGRVGIAVGVPLLLRLPVLRLAPRVGLRGHVACRIVVHARTISAGPDATPLSPRPHPPFSRSESFSPRCRKAATTAERAEPGPLRSAHVAGKRQ